MWQEIAYLSDAHGSNWGLTLQFHPALSGIMAIFIILEIPFDDRTVRIYCSRS
jgi:hypothetical protein